MRGQISLDLLMAVLATIIVLGTFAVVADDIQDNYREMYVQNQLKKVSSELSGFLTATNALDDARFSTELKVPIIYYKDTKAKPNIAIDADQNTINVYVVLDGKTIAQETQFARSPNAVINYDFESRTLKVEKIA